MTFLIQKAKYVKKTENDTIFRFIFIVVRLPRFELGNLVSKTSAVTCYAIDVYEEDVGFELTWLLHQLVFKTSTIGLSVNLPKRTRYYLALGTTGGAVDYVLET